MYRKGVSALIVNSNNEFLLVNLESFADKYFAVPGGGIESKESLEDAVYREIKEELSIEKKSLFFIGKSDLPTIIKFKTIKFNDGCMEYDGMERYFFGLRFIGDEKMIIPNPGEVRSYKWVTYGELKSYLLFDEQLKSTQEKIKEIFTDF